MSGTLLKVMSETTATLEETGRSFLAALANRQAEHVVVQNIADVLLAWMPKLNRDFLAYCSTCFHLQKAFDRQAEGLELLLQATSANPLARNLPVQVSRWNNNPKTPAKRENNGLTAFAMRADLGFILLTSFNVRTILMPPPLHSNRLLYLHRFSG